MKIFILTLFLISFCIPVFAVSYVDDANCMGAWAMEDDGNETDLSGEGGTLVETSGDIPQDADKKFGTYSRDFELADSEYLTHADGLSTDISGVDQKMSIVCFIKMESDSGSAEKIVAKYDDGDYSFQFDIMAYQAEETRMSIQNDTDPAYSHGVGATSITTETWFHLAGVYNDTDIRIYVDGSLDSNGDDNPKSCTHGTTDTSAAFVIGVELWNGTPGLSFDGLIDDLGIFDRDLTSIEVADINTNGLVGAVAEVGQVIMIQ